jgi:hypothetical protein
MMIFRSTLLSVLQTTLQMRHTNYPLVLAMQDFWLLREKTNIKQNKQTKILKRGGSNNYLDNK